MTETAYVLAMVFWLGAVSVLVYGPLRKAFVDYYAPVHQKETFTALDGLRGLAALHVALFHLSEIAVSDLGTLPWAIMPSGRKAVPLFCVLSGFVIIRACQRIGDLESMRRYFLARLRRIAPLFLATTAFFYLAYADRSFALNRFVHDMLGITVLGGSTHPNLAAWSIFAEAQWYVVAPCLVLIAGQRLAVVLAIAVPVLFFAAMAQPWTVHLWAFFALGALTSVVLDKVSHRTAPFVATMVGVWGLAFLFVDFVGFDWVSALMAAVSPVTMTEARGTYPEATLGLGIASSLIVFSSCANGSPLKWILSSTVFRVLGAVSFSVYLWHCVLLPKLVSGVSASWTGPFSSRGDVTTTEALLVYLPAILVVSFVSYAVIERPFLKPSAKKTAPETPAAVPQAA